MGIKQWFEQIRQDIVEKNTIIEIDTGHSILKSKLKDFNLVYMVDKQSGNPEFRLCVIKSEQIGTILVGRELMPQYYNYYVDSLNNNSPLDYSKYYIGNSYYLTSIMPMSDIKSKNYTLNREDLTLAFKETQQQVLSKKRTFK